jgi:hypothetical protein
MSVIAGGAVEQAQTTTQKLAEPFVANATNALATISDTVSNQQNLMTLSEALLQKVGVLVKIGDEVAKVWSSLSSRLLHNSKWLNYEDTPLCEFCVASSLRRNEGAPVPTAHSRPFFLISLLLDGPSPTNSRPEDPRSRRDDGEHLLICYFRG